MGKGAVDERHPLSVGVIGYFMGTRSATKGLRRLVSDADVILFVGDRTIRTAPIRGRCSRPARPTSISTSTARKSAATTRRCGWSATPS